MSAWLWRLLERIPGVYLWRAEWEIDRMGVERESQRIRSDEATLMKLADPSVTIELSPEEVVQAQKIEAERARSGAVREKTEPENG